jgi:hypothetical protein
MLGLTAIQNLIGKFGGVDLDMDTDSQRERLTKSDDMTQHSPHNLKRAG